VLKAAGLDPARVGRDEEALGRIGKFVELHVEQGRGLVDMSAPVGVATSILAHGRWRFRFTGEGNHAGATPMASRRDPMLPASQLVLSARWAASSVDGARATVGRLEPTPGGPNGIASSVDVWLDARAPNDGRTRTVVDRITAAARQAARDEGCEVTVTEESYGDTVHFDSALREEVAEAIGHAPGLPTGAGHDAGILAGHVPTAMLFVRNPTGVSHAPAEHAEPDDCEAGVDALSKVLEKLAT
jgi:N-carbamoyl-L-amino-acid hydrolase